MGAAVAPIAVGAAAGGALLQGYGTYMGMEAQSSNAAFQAQVASNNAAIARTNEKLEFESGEEKTANAEMKARSIVGTQKADQAASGVDVNSGSALSSRAGTAQFLTLDALTIRSDSARKAYGFAVEAQQDTEQSQLDTMESQEAASAAPIAAVGSALSGLGSAGSSAGALKLAGA
jgi:hypothetical protein